MFWIRVDIDNKGYVNIDAYYMFLESRWVLLRDFPRHCIAT